MYKNQVLRQKLTTKVNKNMSLWLKTINNGNGT